VPNTEIVIERDEKGAEQLTLDSRTREALARRLKGKTWTIRRTDDERQPEIWVIKVGTVLPGLRAPAPWSRSPAPQTARP
jgi:hypothetical protein